MLRMLLLDRLNGRKFDNYVPKCHCLKQQYNAAGCTPDIHNLCFIIENSFGHCIYEKTDSGTFRKNHLSSCFG